ncbi:MULTISPECIES: AraC family transcriptional regulator [Ensifer]|jgi:AraC family transcriptional regulator|uniref:Helix-turn-helix domain-containing protein n=1 Tax=Ensifer canadensis TaxID=555315 RepID=A0AAW4FPH1_9HYPH|nr:MULTISPECIES: AraC family transcriptional regulator [Ensifer]AHK44483.1 transcriptional regulator, AraC type [Ensifer adhaerens OV14]MDP9630610.1 AraC family transcriptional regulator [Ensifer adhaerens]KQU86001.1 AraC family transcriptional regulator [Ensifer sp. Root31]KQW58918.1 AraC family transcriptional regulator [Ensifer sp. Root1252]KQW74623.1 AraC family transcriptional regulator [Ensifer sp. Root127]
MDERATWASYERRLHRVSDYIYGHLNEELDLDRLAEIACLSPHHWHRIYRAVHGETLAATVKRLRLQKAAADLVQSDLPVEAIAQRSGYPNIQSFNRTFKAVYGLPPARYRREGSHKTFETASSEGIADMYEVTLKEIDGFDLVGVAHSGSYMGIGKAFETLYGTLISRNLYRPDMEMIGIYLDDPELVPADRLRSFACVTAKETLPADAPLTPQTLEGGRYAVLRHKGPYADMPLAYQWLYGTWLPQSGREVRDSLMFEKYLNNPRDVPPTELLSEIYLPLK